MTKGFGCAVLVSGTCVRGLPCTELARISRTDKMLRIMYISSVSESLISSASSYIQVEVLLLELLMILLCKKLPPYIDTHRDDGYLDVCAHHLWGVWGHAPPPPPRKFEDHKLY